jgi:integrase
MQTTEQSAVARPLRRQRSRVPGIYYRHNAAGKRVYEFVYRDSTGRQRWRGGCPTLKDAQDARGELLCRLRRGERVVPIKATFAEFARQWLADQQHLRPSTRERYRWAIEHHLIPRLGPFRLAEIREDIVAALVRDLSKTHRRSTVKAVINVLSGILGRAVRRGAVASNAVLGLERDEQPKGTPREMRILQRDEIGRLLESAPARHRPLLATLVFCGLRIGEALALRWSDVDLAAGRIRVRWQIDPKTGERVEPKTPNAKRDVVLMPALATMLAEHRIASRFSQDVDPVFSSAVGTPLLRSNVRHRILQPAVKRAGLHGAERPTLRTHDLRHTFASLLIATGASVVFVAAQMGHAKCTVTLDTYAHLFDAREHADKMAAVLEANFAGTLGIARFAAASLHRCRSNELQPVSRDWRESLGRSSVSNSVSTSPLQRPRQPAPGIPKARVYGTF